MKTKILLIGSAIVVIAILFSVPAIRDGREAERFDGRPFPDRSQQRLQSGDVITIDEPSPFEQKLEVAVDLEVLTAADVSPSPGPNLIGELQLQPANAPTTSFALDAPRSGDSLIHLDDESPAAIADDAYLHAEDSLELPMLDDVPTQQENPFDRPIQIPSAFAAPTTAPIEAPVATAGENDSAMLPTIETGSGFAPYGVGQSQLEVNPYADQNSTRVASRDHLNRPIAKPDFGRTSNTALGTNGEASTTANSTSMPTSVLTQTGTESLPAGEANLSDPNQIFDRPIPVGKAGSASENMEPTPADVPIETPMPALMDAPVMELPPAETYNTPIAPNYSAPIQNVPAPIHNSDNAASWNRMNMGGETFGSSSYLQNSWTPSVFQAHDCGDRCGGGHTGFPNRGRWGETSSTLSFGGWFSAGYHEADNQLFNNRPDEFALHQGWLYLEKSATSDSPIGFRVDAIYGIDGADTQAFGNEPGNWDFLNGLDFGAYAWAVPQAYLEVAVGETNVRVGHFFTLIGYETVPAPDNFFYSHAITMFNSEPFTHTGVLVNRKFGDFDVYGGWTLGWDTGFDRFGDGGSWLGGFTYEMSDAASFSYFSSAGDFGARGEDAYSQSVVLNLSLTENMNYVLQSDYLRVESTGEDNVGIVQFTTYSLSDRLSIGSRLEWWKGDVLTGYAPHDAVLPAAGSLSYFATTFGANIRPTDRLVIRPEIRHDWSPAADYDETYFGIDAVWSF